MRELMENEEEPNKMRDWEQYHVFAVLSPSTAKELDDLRKESFKETKQLLKKTGMSKGKKLLKGLANDLDIRKLLSDMYVWQRVEAIKVGMVNAITQSAKKEEVSKKQ